MKRRSVLHVDLSDSALLERIDQIAAIMRVTRSQLVRWWIEDGIDEYTSRIQQTMQEARKNGTSEKSTQRGHNPI